MTDSRARVRRRSRSHLHSSDDALEHCRRTAAAVLSMLELDALVIDALEAIADSVRADDVALLLADGPELVVRAAVGAQQLGGAGSSPAGLAATEVRASAQPLVIDALPSVDHERSVSSQPTSYVGVPLTTGGKVLGVLHATRLSASPFDDRDVELLVRFAEPIAPAVERVQYVESVRDARQKVERANVRVRALQRMTSAIAGVGSVGEICQIIISESVPDGELGEGAIWMLRDDRLLLVAGRGHSANYPEIPLDPSLPAAENLRDGTPLFVESRGELASRWPVLAGGPTAAFAGLPLIVEGRRLGVMAIGYRDEHHFDLDEREYLAAVAEQAASALVRAESLAALQDARDIASERLEQLQFLAHASEQLSGSLNLDITLQTVADLGVPRVTDRCALYLLENGGISKQVLAPELNDDERALFDETESNLTAVSGIGAVIRTGSAVYLEQISDELLAMSAASPDHLALLHRVGFGGILIVPLRARGRTLGALAFVNRRGRPMPSSERRLGEELAARAALAIDNALLYRTESHVARRLTQALLPGRLPSVTGVDVAVRYQAGSSDLQVGGDFYDVIATNDDEVVVLVGDVQGKGVEAASITGLARHTVRACAQSDTSPSSLLEKLNAAILQHNAEVDGPGGGARLCTAAIVRLRRSTDGWIATTCSAGHPLPVIRHRGSDVEEMGRPGLLLGVRADVEYRSEQAAVRPGSAVLLFTDGVADRLGVSMLEVVRRARSTAAELADDVMTAALQSPSTHPDDMVALVLLLEGTEPAVRS
jgi:GAF domain-containing protein